MQIRFSSLKETVIPRLNGGDGYVAAQMLTAKNGKIICSRLPAGASIGMHTHPTSSEICYVVSGMGRAICDGSEEALAPGDCHYCPQHSRHSIINSGQDDLVLFTVVSEQSP